MMNTCASPHRLAIRGAQAGLPVLRLGLLLGACLALGVAHGAPPPDVIVVPVPPAGRAAPARNTAPTFVAGDGRITTAIGGNAYGMSVATQANGGILVAGRAVDDNSGDFTLARYTRDGSLDTKFGGGVPVRTDLGGNDYGYRLRSQADGKILVAGHRIVAGSSDFALARYLSSGAVDLTFGVDGQVTTNFGGQDLGFDMAVQADGGILMAGSSTIPAGTANFIVARYLADGRIDQGFGDDGQVTTDFGGNDRGQAIAIQADGRILVAGTRHQGGSVDFALARYLADGRLDADFGAQGRVVTNFGGLDEAQAIAIQSDGRILVAGTCTAPGTYENFCLARYLTNGKPDPRFGNRGKVAIDFGGRDSGRGIALQADGNILVAGSRAYPFLMEVARYLPNGRLDAGFGQRGIATTDFGGALNRQSTGNAIALQRDGRILLVGHHFDGDSSTLALARHLPDGRPDPAFGGPYTLDGRVRYSQGGPAVLLDDSVEVLDLELSASGQYEGASIMLAREGGAEAEDVFSALGNLTFAGGTAVLSGIGVGTVTQSNGRLSVTFNGNATRERVNRVLSSLAYRNTATRPPDSLKIRWTFNDGNTGAQGAGGALSVSGSTRVDIDADFTTATRDE